MNLKLRRSARTPHSEEISIFDTDIKDEGGEPVNIGKIDVHYVEDQIVGTLLIWAEYAANLTQRTPDVTMTDLIDQILEEITDPIGVPVEYGIEVYYPALAQHEFVSNYEEDDEDIMDFEDEEEPTDGTNGRIH